MRRTNSCTTRNDILKKCEMSPTWTLALSPPKIAFVKLMQQHSKVGFSGEMVKDNKTIKMVTSDPLRPRGGRSG